jgi:amino acid permease
MEYKSSSLNASLNFYKSCMGSGVLAMPYVFMRGGWLLTLILYILIPWMIVYETTVLNTIYIFIIAPPEML